MKKLFVIFFTLTLIGTGASTAYGGLEEEFEEATDIEFYRRGLKDMETALLIKNATGALHNENMKILEKLEELEKRLSGLEEMIESLR